MGSAQNVSSLHECLTCRLRGPPITCSPGTNFWKFFAGCIRYLDHLHLLAAPDLASVPEQAPGFAQTVNQPIFDFNARPLARRINLTSFCCGMLVVPHACRDLCPSCGSHFICLDFFGVHALRPCLYATFR